MLLAEIHGHVLEAAVGDEDYLTSAVFGHLRYLPPKIFWTEFLSQAKALSTDDQEMTLVDKISKAGIAISDYSSLQIYFWPLHTVFGQPGLVLCFTRHDLRPLIVMVEAKLWSEKSGIGENDQLLRYLRIFDVLQNLSVSLPQNAEQALVYLTPRESINEIVDSLAHSQDIDRDRQRMFRLQWQDLVVAAARTIRSAQGVNRTIVCDVLKFLQRRNLEYFNGFLQACGVGFPFAIPTSI